MTSTPARSSSALLTDHYELTMIAAALKDGTVLKAVVDISGIAVGKQAFAAAQDAIAGKALDDKVIEAVLGGTTRLPAKLTEAAERELTALPGWAGHPWLKYALEVVP